LVTACGSVPPLPPARLQVRDVAERAVRAAQAGSWHEAAADWHEAAREYSALDDWDAAGHSELGEAQALAMDGGQDGAMALLVGIDAGKRYSELIRAEAIYQLALIDIGRHEMGAAVEHLQSAAAHLPPDNGLQAAIANAQGRVAMHQGDYASVAMWAVKALKVGGIVPSERANAWRLAAAAALAAKDIKAADMPLRTALDLDKQLARPAAIAADLRLMANLTRLRGDVDAEVWAERADAACAALKAGGCGAAP
jgi:tetratricopeptide (TPR) repeat protein